MSQLRNLAYERDRDRAPAAPTRRSWRPGERGKLPLAAAMNGIKGQVQTLWPAARLGVAAGRGALSATTSTARRSTRCWSGARVLPRLPPLPARQGARARAGARWPGTTCSRLVSQTRRLDVGRGAGVHRARLRGLLGADGRVCCRAPSTSTGSTPSPGPASRMAPSACRCGGDESRILANYKPVFNG